MVEGATVLDAQISDDEALRIIEYIRIGSKVVLDGQEYYIVNGYISDKEKEIAGNLLKYDERIGEYLTTNPKEFIRKVAKGGGFQGDIYASWKYLTAVKNGRVDLAEQTEIAWRNFIHLLNEDTRRVLSKVKFSGDFWDFKTYTSDNNLYLKEPMKPIGGNPPFYKYVFEDEKGEEYVAFHSQKSLDDGYGFVVMWKKRDLEGEKIKDIINAFKLAYYNRFLFTGLGKVIEQGQLGNGLMKYAILNIFKYSIVKDETENKYIVNAVIDTGSNILPVIYREFNDLEKARKFVKENIIKKFMEFEEEMERMYQKVLAQERAKERDFTIGGMYG